MNVIPELIFGGLWGTMTARFFTVFIFVLFGVSWISVLKRNEKSQYLVENAPNILTTLGLFGTFWGIAKGLGAFDVKNIDASVPALLEGMKLAFWTSILGMFTSLVLKFTHFLRGFFKKIEVDEGVSADDIFKIMNEQKGILSELKNTLGADEDRSIITQIQLIKSDMADFHKSVIKEFRNFAQDMAKNNSEALIEALKAVIKDFNAKINEQFGENFKELNRAVGALLEWQENYRDHVEKLTSSFQTALFTVEITQKAIEKIREDAESIPNTMQSLQRLLEKLDQEVEKASELLKGFAALRTQADEVFPIIKEGLETLTEEFSDSVKQSTNAVELTITKQNNSIEAMAKRVAEIAIGIDSEIEKGLHGIDGHFKKTLSDIETSTKKHYESFDKQLEAEMESVIKLLGGKLASVAQKLVDDYTMLGNKIAGLIERSREKQ